MKINVLIGDITQLKVDAIVNAANSSLLGGSGVDGAIHKAAGKHLVEECRKLNGCHIGDAKLTKGYNLLAKYVIHTVGPVWNGGNKNEKEILKKCYLNSLKIASYKNLNSVAFPCISTGRFGFPINLAAEIAISTVRFYLTVDKGMESIYFVCYDKQNYNEYVKLLELN